MSTQSDRIIAALNERCAVAETQLAAANALLTEARRALDDMLERYQAQGLTSIKAQAIADRLRAQLAAQPATAPARTEHPMTPPYAVLGDESVVPLMNCPECKEMGRADMAHYHVCPRVVTDADMRVLEACAELPEQWLRDGSRMRGVPATWLCSAELARREGK